MTNIQVIVATALFLFANLSFSEELSDSSSVLSLSEKSIALLADKKYQQAFDVLMPYWNLPESEVKSLAYQVQAGAPLEP